MPTIEIWLTTTTRAARLGVSLLIVAGSHIEVLRDRRLVARVAAWGEVAVYLDTIEALNAETRSGREQEKEWRLAA